MLLKIKIDTRRDESGYGLLLEFHEGLSAL